MIYPFIAPSSSNFNDQKTYPQGTRLVGMAIGHLLQKRGTKVWSVFLVECCQSHSSCYSSFTSNGFRFVVCHRCGLLINFFYFVVYIKPTTVLSVKLLWVVRKGRVNQYI